MQTRARECVLISRWIASSRIIIITHCTRAPVRNAGRNRPVSYETRGKKIQNRRTCVLCVLIANDPVWNALYEFYVSRLGIVCERHYKMMLIYTARGAGAGAEVLCIMSESRFRRDNSHQTFKIIIVHSDVIGIKIKLGGGEGEKWYVRNAIYYTKNKL